uniref:Pectinesterase n=1 Tax=Kalanchoe fedtschenkoi TaxID=63787 RepID=A0A7N0T8I1_KALFE
MDATTVAGGKNVVDGTPTFDTAPFAVMGKGLVARDMGFRNTAGAAKHQAVAMRSSGDFSVFYLCKFDAFQDTLYTHANRQFYRECLITGTIDFIFGNSAAVFQNCNIQPRLPMNGQKNTITAQGKSDPNQNTGLSFQNCTISPFNNLGSDYSTTVFINSFFGSLIHPKGWLPWTGTSAPSTIFYAVFQNSGPGSNTQNRVKWKGLRTITASVANKFTVDSFISGSTWISAAGVPFKGGL